MLQGPELQQAYHNFITDYSEEKGLSIKTIKNKQQALDDLLPFLNGRPLTPENCREYIKFKFKNGWKSGNSRTNIVKNVRAFVHYLFKRKYIPENFALELEKPKVIRKPLKLVSEQQAYDMILAGTEPGPGDNSRNARIKAESRQCLLLFLFSGLRVKEGLELKGDDLLPYDDEPSMYITSKGGKTSLMPIPSNMVEEMKLRVKKRRVFETTRETLNKHLKDGGKKLGIPIIITCHRLRDIYSLTRLRRKQPLPLVSRTLRHSSVLITDKYYSDYVLTDLVPVVNDSALIIKSLPAKEKISKALQEFQNIIDKDTGIYVEVKVGTDGSVYIAAKPVEHPTTN